MKNRTSRRGFLTAGMILPVASQAGAAAAGTPVPASAGVLQPAGAGKAEVRYATLGKTGIKISRLGFGCMLTSDASVLERAADMGINHFDTARVYARGNNERLVGTALKSRRKNLIISTKTLNTKDKASALADLETSLKTIGTDYVDIWYLHDKRSAADITDELIDAQQTAKKAGKIRFSGLSLHAGHKEVIPAVIKNGTIDVLLTTYNFAMDPYIEDLIAQARKAGVGVVAMKVMAGSFRLDDYDYDRARSTLKRPGAMLAALKWIFRNPNVDCAIPSMTDQDQLEENFRAMAAPFGDADRKLLARRLEQIRPMYCRMCGSCDGTCPKGLPVADMLRYLMYADGYGQFPLGREMFQQLPEAVQGVRCSDCGDCIVRCVAGVNVAERLKRAQELFA